MLRKFSYSYRHAEQSVPKAYLVDNGLLRANGIKDKGRLMENLIFIELMRRNLDIAYYKSVTKEEVDFLIKEGKSVKQLIQACYDISNFNTKEREVKALIKASKELECRNLLVITWDYESEERLGGKNVKFTPLWKWLLAQPASPAGR
jgi:predicted AAA+ superfamily ATPase